MKISKHEYPDNTLELALREKGFTVQCMWQMKGPKNSMVAWIECLLVDRVLFIVETYNENQGWDVFIQSSKGQTSAVIDQVARSALMGGYTL